MELPGGRETDYGEGPQGQKRPADVNGNAVTVARIATGEEEETSYKHPNKVNGCVEGGKARAEKLSPEERKRIAQKAALTRCAAKAKTDGQ